MLSRSYPKLAFKFYGPFSVLQKIGQAAYKLALRTHSLIHPVFHVSQLKPFTPNQQPAFSELPAVHDLGVTNLIPEQVLDRHLVKKGNHAVPQVLVKWNHVPVEGAT